MPARSPRSISPHTVTVALAIVAAAVVIALYVVNLGATWPNSDEAIYAQFIREMRRSGDYFTLSWQGHAVLQRPAAPIALYALVSAVVPGEVGMRLAPAILSAIAALTAAAVVWARSRRPFAALAALLVCAGTPTYFTYGKLLFSDPPFVLAVTAALAATLAALHHPRWFLWIGVALGAAVGAKSLAAAIPAVGLLPGIVIALRRHGWRRCRLPAALAVALALAAPFYVVGLIQHGGRFIAEHFGYNLLSRAKGIPGIGLPQSPFAYVTHLYQHDGLPSLLVVLGAPAVAAIVAAVRRDAELAVAAAAPIVTFALLSLLGTRLPHYLLVFIPMSAVSLGLVLARLPAVAAPVLAAAAALLMWHTTGQPPRDANVWPASEAHDLGEVASLTVPAGQPVYSLDWYAPAFGWYANREWRLLGSEESWMTYVGSVDVFRAAGTVSVVPPFPPGRFFVAAAPVDFKKHPELHLVRILARAGGYELWEAGAP